MMITGLELFAGNPEGDKLEQIKATHISVAELQKEVAGDVYDATADFTKKQNQVYPERSRRAKLENIDGDPPFTEAEEAEVDSLKVKITELGNKALAGEITALNSLKTIYKNDKILIKWYKELNRLKPITKTGTETADVPGNLYKKESVNPHLKAHANDHSFLINSVRKETLEFIEKYLPEKIQQNLADKEKYEKKGVTFEKIVAGSDLDKTLKRLGIRLYKEENVFYENDDLMAKINGEKIGIVDGEFERYLILNKSSDKGEIISVKMFMKENNKEKEYIYEFRENKETNKLEWWSKSPGYDFEQITTRDLNIKPIITDNKVSLRE